MSNKHLYWKILNSPFVIWFLSSAIITTISWTYTNWKSNEASKALNNENIRKLDYEILNRIQYIESTFKYLVTSEKNEFEKNEVIIRFFSCPNFPWTLYIEYKDRNLKSLLMELNERVSNSEKRNIIEAINILNNLMVDYEMKSKSFNYGEFLLKVNMIKKHRWDTLLNTKKELKNELEKNI